MKSKYVSIVLAVLLGTIVSYSQNELPNAKITNQITSFKNDIRGPYKDIRWFCTDGSIRQPKDPCPDNIGPGVQHARYKDEVVSLGKEHHIYLGQILAYTSKEEFWDTKQELTLTEQFDIDKELLKFTADVLQDLYPHFSYCEKCGLPWNACTNKTVPKFP